MDKDEIVQDERLVLYLKLGRLVLPVTLFLGLTVWLIIDKFYPASYEINALLNTLLGGPIPDRLRDALSFVKHYGVPGTLAALVLISACFPSRLTWLLPLERICGQGFIRIVDLFSRFGEYLFHHRRVSQTILWLCGALAVSSLVKAYEKNQSSYHMTDLMLSLNDEMIDLVGGSILHYRNKQAFEPIKDSMSAMSRWDKNSLQDMIVGKHPTICLYSVLDYVHEGTADQWSKISKEIADLDEVVPVRLSGKCRSWKEYREGVPLSDGLYRDAFAGLTLAVARVNERLSLEGTSGSKTFKAAKLYLDAQKIYEKSLPERIVVPADNGLGNYFSACFARWPDLNCDKIKEGRIDLVCDSLEGCYESAERHYQMLNDQNFRLSDQDRRENNTFDLKMKALIRFAPPQALPIYVKSTLIMDAQRVDSAAKWLDQSIERLEVRARESHVAPELYVTLSQLYAVRLAYLKTISDSAHDAKRITLVRSSIENLEISQRLLALDRDYFMFDVGHRGWCYLMQDLEITSPAKQELKQRFLSIAGAFLQGDAQEWFSDSCAECKQRN